jgi:hypothetical protein
MATQLPTYKVNESYVPNFDWSLGLGSFGGDDYDWGYDDNGNYDAGPIEPAPEPSQKQRIADAIKAAIEKENAKRKAEGKYPISPIYDGEAWTKIAMDAEASVLNKDNSTSGEQSTLSKLLSATTSNNTPMATTGTSGWGSFITPENIGGLAAIAGSLIASKDASKAATAAGQAGQVDIEALDQKAREIAQQNALESAALEEMLTPEVPEIRRQGNRAVLGSIGETDQDRYTNGLLEGFVNNPVENGQSPLLKAAIAKAKSDLALGGKLDRETQNQVTRTGLARAGEVGSMGLGRDVVARDLGLTSLDLQQRRLAAASQVGGQELQMNQFDADTGFNNKTSIMNAIQLMNATQGAQFGRNLSAAQYGQSIAPPTVGLDPSAVVNLSVGNSNAAGAAAANTANIKGQQSQNLLNFGGQLAANALIAYNKSGYTPPKT